MKMYKTIVARGPMGDYVKMSTANPTGWRPWNSRLSGLACPAPLTMRQGGLSAFYIENSFPLPTTGRGRFLLQPGVNARPTVSGGMGDDTGSIFGISFDPTLMIAGVGILMLALYLSGRKSASTPKRRRKKKPGRVRRALQQLTAGS